MTSKLNSLKVYYDGGCVVCSKEMDIYKKKDKSKKIDFIDITSASFDAKLEGLDPDEVHSVFHVKDENNEIHTGIDGFIAIWDTLKIFSPLSCLAKSTITRPVFDFGYLVFTKIRPFLPRKKCDDGTCDT